MMADEDPKQHRLEDARRSRPRDVEPETSIFKAATITTTLQKTKAKDPSVSAAHRSAVSNQQSSVSNQQSAISDHRSALSSQQSAVNNKQSTTSSQQFATSNLQRTASGSVGIQTTTEARRPDETYRGDRLPAAGSNSISARDKSATTSKPGNAPSNKY
jgi:hypothetical protein